MNHSGRSLPSRNERLPGAQNYQITATEREGEVVFLHRLERGRASKSYGIEVARLAGLPPAVLANAREVLARLERYELDVFGEGNGLEKAATRKAAAQASLFDLANQRVIEEIRAASATISGEEAIDMLRRLKEQLM